MGKEVNVSESIINTNFCITENDVPPVKETRELKEKDDSENSRSRCKEDKDSQNEKEEGEEDGEKVESELEEGELSDGDEARPEETEPRPVCRFYNRGQCTWGVSCRFLHPGVTDKGNYTMFDMVRPLSYPSHASHPPHEYRPHIERPLMRPMPSYSSHMPPPKTEDPASETSWERGLRQAKDVGSTLFSTLSAETKIINILRDSCR